LIVPFQLFYGRNISILGCDFSNLNARVVWVAALSHPSNDNQFCIIEKTKFVNVEANGGRMIGIDAEYDSQFFNL
jgi:hypothetical protein